MSSETSSDEIDITEVYNSAKSKVSGIFRWKYTYEILLIPIIWLTWWIRTRNLDLLQNKYLLGLDPYYYYRLANEVLATGILPTFDTMRIYPFGKTVSFNFFPYFLAYWNKFLNIFGDFTLLHSNILYNPIFTAFSIVFFFLFLKNVFDKKVALLASLILIVSPAYLFRTVAGFADHEALFMFLMFLSLWLFSEIKLKERFSRKIWFAIASGFVTFLAATTWSAIPILTVPVGVFILLEIFWDNRNRKYFAAYSIWLASYLIPLLILRGLDAIKDISVLVPLFALASLGVYIGISHRAILRLPAGLTSILITAAFGVTVSLVFGIINFGRMWKVALSPAESTGRVAETISEIIGGTALFNMFDWLAVLALAGAVLAAYYGFEDRHQKAKLSLAAATLIVGGITLFTNQTVLFNMILLLAFSITFLIIYTLHKSFTPAKNHLIILPLVMFLFTAYLTNTGARFLFVFAPPVAIFASYFVFKAVEISPKNYKTIISIVLIALMVPLIYNDFESTTSQAEHMGSSLPGQWQTAFEWLRENTPENSGIAHWWDYGYWTQSVGERPSIADGGTHKEYMLYLLGRYGMTGQSREEALTYYNTHNISYLLFSREEIGKYWAFSHIGSNKDMDRESTIGSFGLSEIMEVRNGNRLVYKGGWNLDHDIVIEGKVFKKNSASITEFSMLDDGSDGKVTFTDGTRTVEDSLHCLINGNRKLYFNTDSIFKGCFMFIPSFNDEGQGNPQGAALYLSEKVVDGLFARLYLLGEDIPGFEAAYQDSNPLGIYRGQIIGPVRIWEVSYSSEIGTNDLWRSISKEYEEGFR